MPEVIRKKAAFARCGTTSGYTRHQRSQEKPCNACAAAKARYDARWRSAPRRRQMDRLKAQAQSKALLELSRRHPDEYRQLYESAKTELLASISGTPWAEGGEPE